MVVIYAEKPDMGEKIASSLGGSTFHKSEKKEGYYKINFSGKEYYVTWGYGHLCELSPASGYNPEYKNWAKMPMPFIPDEYKIVPKDGVNKTLSFLKGLFNKSEYIINATDFDREGELIFRLIYDYLKCKKPVMRAKLSSTTKEGICDAFKNLVPESEVEGILKSARCRSIADWVVGCNLTAAMTLKYSSGMIYSIGRVQTPTLAMVVARDESIAAFKPENFFVVEAEFTPQNGGVYIGIHKEKRFPSKKEADDITTKCNNKQGKIIEVEKKIKKKAIPNLYSLDTLQMEANSRYGMSLKQTLDVTQRLYEKGYVTYPRTDCQYLPEDMYSQICAIQELLRNGKYQNLFNSDAQESNMSRNKKRFFDDSKLGSHYAIIPTKQIPGNLDPAEEKIYSLIADSVIRMLYPDAEIATISVLTEVEGEVFKSEGSSIEKKGWLSVHGSSKEVFLPSLQKNDTVSSSVKTLQKKTEPPKHYTEKTLLGAMVSAGKTLDDEELKEFMSKNEINGIGTVATRAGIIETLIHRKFIEKEGKSIISTSTGRNLIHQIPIDEVKSAVMTASYEKRLNMIMKEKDDPDDFLSSIYKDIELWCKKIGDIKMSQNKNSNENGTGMTCPSCGKELVKFSWGYGCSGYQDGCKFAVGTSICGKNITENQVKKLLTNKKIGPLSGFTSKAGKKFEAFLILKPSERPDTKYEIGFEFPKSEQETKEDIIKPCPVCGSKIIRGRWGWECESKCGFSVPYKLCERNIEPGIVETICQYGETGVLDGFISKKGKPFSAKLQLLNGRVSFDFSE